MDDVAPLVRSQELEILSDTYKKVLAGGREISDDDLPFVVGSLLNGLLPRLSAVEQLSVLNLRPPHMPEWLNFLRVLKPMPTDEFDKELKAAHNTGDMARLRRVFFMSSTGLTPISERAGEVVLQAFSSDDDAISHVAAETIYQNNNRRLRRELLKRIDEHAIGIPDPKKFCESRAFAEAAIENGRRDLFTHMAPRFRGCAAEVFGDQCLEEFTDDLERMVTEQLAPIRTDPLGTAEF